MIIVSILYVAAACREQSDGTDPIIPQRVSGKSNADATAAFGTMKNQTQAQLSLALPDRNAGQEPADDAAIIDSCIDFLPASFEVGEAKCVGSNKAIKLTAGMFKQVCYVQGSESRSASQTLKLSCDEAQLFLFTFDPPLRAKIN
jgi:hypothetical protein